MADLDRFLTAQADRFSGYAQALTELRAGHKTSHWIWYIFPQLPLGSSSMAQRYALADIAEAEAYLRHPMLRARLQEITAAAHDQAVTNGVPLRTLMGSHIDVLKLVSSLTLFEGVARRLDVREQLRDAGRLVTTASAILDVADRQGFPRCQVTARALAAAYPAES